MNDVRILIYRDGVEIEGENAAADELLANVFGHHKPWRIASSDSQYGEALRQCNKLAEEHGAKVINVRGESIAKYCRQPGMSFKELTDIHAAESAKVDHLAHTFNEALSEVMSEKEFIVGKYTRHAGGWTCMRQSYMGINHWRWVLEPPTATFYKAIGHFYKSVQDCRLVTVPTNTSYSLWLREESR